MLTSSSTAILDVGLGNQRNLVKAPLEGWKLRQVQLKTEPEQIHKPLLQEFNILKERKPAGGKLHTWLYATLREGKTVTVGR
jgi:hypothetical protein